MGLTAAAAAWPGSGMPAPHPRSHRMTPSQHGNQQPTARQLAYLKALAARTGQTFTWPRTRAQASREIRQLRGVRGSGFTFGELQAEEADGEARHDAPAIRSEEIAGYGASATWRHRTRPPRPSPRPGATATRSARSARASN
jgi:hypothetical protein